MPGTMRKAHEKSLCGPQPRGGGLALGAMFYRGRHSERERGLPKAPQTGVEKLAFNALPSGATGSSALSCRPPSGSSAEAIYSLAE